MGPLFINFYPGYRFSLHYVNLYYINCNIKCQFVISTMYLLLSVSFPCLPSTEFCHKNSYNEYSLILLLMNPMQLQWVMQYNCCQLFIELITECFQQHHYINGHLIFMLIFSSHTLKYYSLHGFFPILFLIQILLTKQFYAFHLIIIIQSGIISFLKISSISSQHNYHF